MKHGYKRNKVAVVVPALNEAETIERVVSKLVNFGEVIVVNDGSVDRTSEIAEGAGAFVINHGTRLGYNEAIWTGLVYSVRRGYKWAITIDADNQFAPSLIEMFAKKLSRDVDLVVGIRPYKQRISEHVFGFFGSLLWSVPDPLCGVKGYNLDILRSKVFGMRRFSFDSIGVEPLVRMIKLRVTVVNVSVTMSKRIDKPRFGSGVVPNCKIIVALIYCLFLYWFVPMKKRDL